MITPIIYDFVADVRHDNRFLIGKVPQGDTGSRYLNITVTNNGVPYTLPTTGVLYICNGTNGAGGVVYVTCSVVNNKVRINLPDSMVNYAGIGKYRVSMYSSSDENTILSSFTFNIAVEADPTDISGVTVEDDYSALQDLISVASGFNKWITGTGIPSSSYGNTLDLYLDTDSGNVYQIGASDWVYKCTLGASLYIAYADDSSGTGFTTTYVAGKNYIGISTNQSQTQPTTPSAYTWMQFVPTGAMTKADYGGSDDHTVSQADKLKGMLVISGITIPSRETVGQTVTTVVVTNEAIATSSIVEGIYTTEYGLNPINVILNTGSMTMTFPARSTPATAMVKIWNVGNYTYPDPMNYDDIDISRETSNIDFSNFNNSV